MKNYLLLMILVLPLALSSCKKENDKTVSKKSLEGTVWVAQETSFSWEMKIIFAKTSFILEAYTDNGTERLSGTYIYDYPIIRITVDGDTEVVNISDGNKFIADFGDGDAVTFVLQK